MNSTAAPRHPFKAVVAVAAMAVLLHGVHAYAGTEESEIVRIPVIGQMPLHTACPDMADDDLVRALGPAWEVADRPSTVAVSFKVQGNHVFDVFPATHSARVYHQIRRVVRNLSCEVDDDRPHTVRFVVTFVDGAPDSRVATIVDVAQAYQPTP